MKILSVAEYDNAESSAMAYVPNRIVECVKPVLFDTVGYPTRVSSDLELVRYLDVMHEGRFEGDFHERLGGLTEDEYQLFKFVCIKVSHFSSELFNITTVPISSLIRAFLTYRHIRTLYPDTDTTILEIGPGSGYLGALLALSGYRYVATDISQAFYLYQNIMFNYITDGKVRELVSDETPMEQIDEVESGSILHIPWWKFVVPKPNFKLKVDAVTCNHALCEMHVRSLAYSIKLSRELLTSDSQKETLKSFLFEGWGNDIRTPTWYIVKAFVDLGYDMSHDDNYLTVFSPKGTPGSVNAERFPREERSFVKTTNPFDYPEKVFFEQYHPFGFQSAENVVSRAVMQGRKNFAQLICYGINDVKDIVYGVGKSTEIMTPDEIFNAYVETK